MAHGVEPILPFDITLATILVPDLIESLTTDELITIRARQLEKCQDDLATIHTHILKSRFASAQHFERQHVSNAPRLCARGCVCPHALMFCLVLLDYILAYLLALYLHNWQVYHTH